MARKGDGNAIDKMICESTKPDFFKVICYISILFTFFIKIGWFLETLVAWQVISLAYISMQQQKVNYSSKNYEILQKDGKWTYDALGIMNVK